MSSGRVHRARLRNGLQVLLKEIHTAPITSVWIWYRVGSRNERAGQTGVSHWVEHMQFKGTPAFPAGRLDRAISREGGAGPGLAGLDILRDAPTRWTWRCLEMTACCRASATRTPPGAR
jgi:zinc protease